MILFALFASNCAHGPDVTGCVVDSNNSGFQCSNKKYPKGFFLSLQDGKKLICTSPDEIEQFLKQCKQGKVIDVVECVYDDKQNLFGCGYPGAQLVYFPIDQLDNYFCLSAKDKRRIIERCQTGQGSNLLEDAGYVTQ